MRRVLATMLVATWILVPGRVGAASGCRSGDPMANVQPSKHLKVLNRCVTASGTVVSAKKNPDGDWHMFLRTDPGSTRYENQRNVHAGGLVGEVVPADAPGCTKGQPVQHGVCTGAHLQMPHVGQHVSITGPWVLDPPHGWNEIHPIWAVN